MLVMLYFQDLSHCAKASSPTARRPRVEITTAPPLRRNQHALKSPWPCPLRRNQHALKSPPSEDECDADYLEAHYQVVTLTGQHCTALGWEDTVIWMDWVDAALDTDEGEEVEGRLGCNLVARDEEACYLPEMKRPTYCCCLNRF